MLLSTLRTPLEEEEERARGGVAKPEREGRGAVEGERTSIDITGSFKNYGLRSITS
jgi:hypothetical protein